MMIRIGKRFSDIEVGRKLVESGVQPATGLSADMGSRKGRGCGGGAIHLRQGFGILTYRHELAVGHPYHRTLE
jgi:hypothetical protein